MTIGKCRLVILAATWQLMAASPAAQVVRLPPVAPPAEQWAGWVVSEADQEAGLLNPLVEPGLGSGCEPAALPPSVPAEPENPDRPPDARDGVFQKAIFTSTWLDSGGSSGFGITELELKTVFGLPVPSRRSPLAVTPAFSVHYLDEPEGADLPPRVYEASVQFRWWKRFTPRFGVDFAAAPGLFSDFEHVTGDAFRIPSHIVGKFQWTPGADLVFGVAYLDREDVNFLPIGGIVWTPNEDLKLDLVFPRPRIARRVCWCGNLTDEVQDWAYVAGEFGTEVWAIRRASGADDVLTYRDLRLLLGVERRALRGIDARLEVGYVSSRRLEFASHQPEIEPDDTILIRAGLTY